MKSNKIILFSIFIFMTIGLTMSTAQKNDVEVIVFDDDSPRRSSSDDQKTLIIKTNPFSFLTQRVFVEAEKSITPLIGLQIGAGMTFGINPKEFSVFSLLLSEGGSVEQGIEGIKFRKGRKGFLFSTSAKFYYDEESPDGSYLSVVGNYTRRASKTQKIVENNGYNKERIEDEFENEFRNSYSFSLRYGYQYLHTTMISEYFIGLGVVYHSGEIQDITEGVYGCVNGIKTFKYKLPLIEVGVRVGFQI